MAGTKPDEAVSEIELLNSERILDEVDQFDKRHNHGAPAKYVQTLNK